MGTRIKSERAPGNPALEQMPDRPDDDEKHAEDQSQHYEKLNGPDIRRHLHLSSGRHHISGVSPRGNSFPAIQRSHRKQIRSDMLLLHDGAQPGHDIRVLLAARSTFSARSVLRS